MKGGLDAACSPKVNAVDDGVEAGGLEAEFMGALDVRFDIVGLAEVELLDPDACVIPGVFSLVTIAS